MQFLLRTIFLWPFCELTVTIYRCFPSVYNVECVFRFVSSVVYVRALTKLPDDRQSIYDADVFTKRSDRMRKKDS